MHSYRSSQVFRNFSYADLKLCNTYVHVCTCVLEWVHTSVCRPEEDAGYPRAGVIGGYEVPDVGACLIQILCESTVCS